MICSAGLVAATTAKKSVRHKSPTHKPTQHKSKATARKKSTAPAHKKRATTRHSKSSQSARRAPKRTWRTGQMTPTPDRYREIQGALVKKGYLHQDPTGKWDDESAAALRRFQQDQNLEPTGKLNSLSIIALGLGPRYEAAADTPHAPQQ